MIKQWIDGVTNIIQIRQNQASFFSDFASERVVFDLYPHDLTWTSSRLALDSLAYQVLVAPGFQIPGIRLGAMSRE